MACSSHYRPAEAVLWLSILLSVTPLGPLGKVVPQPLGVSPPSGRASAVQNNGSWLFHAKERSSQKLRFVYSKLKRSLLSPKQEAGRHLLFLMEKGCWEGPQPGPLEQLRPGSHSQVRLSSLPGVGNLRSGTVFTSVNGYTSTCIISSVLPLRLQSLKYLLSGPLRNRLPSPC